MNTLRRPRLSVVLLIAAIAMGGALVSCGRQRQPEQSEAARARKFCGPDGQLRTTQPIQTHRTYCVLVSSLPEQVTPRTPLRLAYTIIDDRGQSLRRFATVHEKQMHLIAVRGDLQQFQHLHPAFNEASGEFTLEDLSFPTVGPYRLFADFTPVEGQIGPAGEPLGVTIPFDVAVEDTSSFRGQPLGEADLQEHVAGYSIEVRAPQTLVAGNEVTLNFRIERDGKLVKDLEPYLGALGHAVVLREGDLQFLHAHPVEQSASSQIGEITFAVHFPMAGRYKAFVQLQHRGEVLTAAFVLPPVEAGAQSMPQSHTGH